MNVSLKLVLAALLLSSTLLSTSEAGKRGGFRRSSVGRKISSGRKSFSKNVRSRSINKNVGQSVKRNRVRSNVVNKNKIRNKSRLKRIAPSKSNVLKKRSIIKPKLTKKISKQRKPKVVSGLKSKSKLKSKKSSKLHHLGHHLHHGHHHHHGHLHRWWLRPILLPPIRRCPPVYSPCVAAVCPGVVVDRSVYVDPIVAQKAIDDAEIPTMKLAVGKPATLEAEGLGTESGTVAIEVGGVGLPAEVTSWSDELLAINVPFVGLTGPTPAKLHLFDSTGQPLASTPVELIVPAETAPAEAAE